MRAPIFPRRPVWKNGYIEDRNYKSFLDIFQCFSYESSECKQPKGLRRRQRPGITKKLEEICPVPMLCIDPVYTSSRERENNDTFDEYSQSASPAMSTSFMQI